MSANLVRYFRLYYENHIVGFKRTRLAQVEYLSLTETCWVQKELLHDAEILLSIPPMGISTYPSERKEVI